MYELQKKLTWSSIRAGVVIFLAMLFLTITIFFSGNIKEIFSAKSTLLARFSNVQGLRTGAPVMVFGYEIGIVKKITITDRGADVKLSINKKYISTIHANARAVVRTMGILGDKYIEIDPGNSEMAQIQHGDTISGVNTVGLEQIMASASAVMLQLDSTMKTMGVLLTSIMDRDGSLGKLINDPELYKNLTLTSKSLANITSRFDAPGGTFWQLMKDSTLYQNINNATELFTSLITQIYGGMGNGGMAGALVNDKNLATDVHQTIISLKNSSEAISELIKDIKKDPRKYFNFQLF